MQQVLLVYHSAQADNAQQIMAALMRITAQVSLIASDLKSPTDVRSALVDNPSQRIVWLLSDNFLKNMASATLFVEASQASGVIGRSFHILVPGVERNAHGNLVETPTRVSKVSHVIHYMNHWQELYLDMRRQAGREINGSEAIQENIKIVRNIYQNIGDILRQVKEKEATDFHELRQAGFQPLYTWLGAGQASIPIPALQTESITVIPEDQSIPQASSGVSQPQPSTTVEKPQPAIAENHVAPEPPTKFVTSAPGLMLIENLIDTGLQQSDAPVPEPIEESGPVDHEPPAPLDLELVGTPFFDQATPDVPDIEADIPDLVPVEQVPADASEPPTDNVSEPAVVQDVDLSTLGGLDPEIEALLKAQVHQNFKNDTKIDDSGISLSEHSTNIQTHIMPVDEIKSDSEQAILLSVPIRPIIREVNPVKVVVKSSTVVSSSNGGPDEPTPTKLLISTATAQERLQKAVHEADAGQTEHALHILSALIADEPDFLVARLTLAGIQAQELGDYTAACTTLEGLLLIDPRQEDALYLMGQYCKKTGEVWRSKLYWERLAELNPDYKNIHELIADLLAEYYKGQIAQTEYYYRKAIARDQGNLSLMSKYATFLTVVSNNYDAAAMMWLKVLDLDPKNEVARQQLIKLKELGADVELPGYQEQPTGIINDNGLVVLVTGASTGIGRATADIFAQHGYRVILAGRRTDLLEQAQADLTKKHNNYNLSLTLDVRTPDAIQSSLAELPEAFSNIDILINNAGLAKGLAPIHEGDLDHWNQMIDTNIKGLLYVTRFVAPAMVARRKGHIVNIGSTAGKEVYPSGNVYCATKFAVDALTRAMRQDLYTHGIRVSQVSPGHVEGTEFAVVRFDGDTERANIYEHFRPLHAEDVARVIYFVITQPPHVNIQDVLLMSTQQAGALLIDHSGR